MTKEQLTTEVMNLCEGMNITIRAKAYAKESEIREILSLSADAVVNSAESLMGAVNFGGRVNFRVIYSDTDGNLNSLNYFADFSDRLICDYAEPKSNVVVKARVAKVEHETRGREADITANLQIDAYVINSNVTELLKEGANMHFKNKSVTLNAVGKARSYNFTFESEQQLNSSVTKLLMAEAAATVEKAYVNEDVLTAAGRLYLNVLHLHGEEIKGQILEIPFNEEINTPHLQGADRLSVDIFVNSVKIHMDITEGEESNTLTAIAGLGVNIIPFTSIERQVAVDAFSTLNETEITALPLTNTVYAGKIRHSFLNEGQIPSEGLVKPLALTGLAARIANVRTEGSVAVIQGIQDGSLLYLDSEGKVSSLKIEMPFAAEVSSEHEFSLARASIAITSATFRRMQNFVEIAFVSEIDVDCFQKFTVNAVSDITVNAEREKNMSGIEVCFAQAGETLWEISKSLLMSEEEIRALNPDIQTPLKETTKILVYRKL